MTHRNELDRRRIEGTVELECLLAGNPEDVGDPFRFETFDQQVRSGGTGHGVARDPYAARLVIATWGMSVSSALLLTWGRV
jgi:hypothetical protein